MLLINASVRESTIAGLGLFLEQELNRGEAAAIFSHGLQVMPEENYLECTLAGDELIIRTGCRWIKSHFIYRESGVEDEDFVNHSQTPNLLYHCGVCFARRDIHSGEELTLDYKYLLSEAEPGFFDSVTGKYVQGLPGRDALLGSTRELARILGRQAPSAAKPGKKSYVWRSSLPEKRGRSRKPSAQRDWLTKNSPGPVKRVDPDRLILAVESGAETKTIMLEFGIKSQTRLKALYLDALTDKGLVPGLSAFPANAAGPVRLAPAKAGTRFSPAPVKREVGLPSEGLLDAKKVKAGLRVKKTR
ncbi:MAG: SET domain-containing protein [Pseudomonadota bacterium]